MKHNPDDRRDNVKKIKENIDNTIDNMEAAEDMIAVSENPQTKKELREKNERREQALEGLRDELKDEVKARKQSNH